MEVFTIFLSSLITILSPVGLVADKLVADALRSQVADVETLAVRIDNTPTYQAIGGKIDRIRIASRGIEIIEDLRIDSFELETDSIDIDLNQIQQARGIKNIQSSLNKPLQGAVRMVIQEDDLNAALEAYNVRSQLKNLIDSILPDQVPQFEILKLQLNFMEENRLSLEIELEQATSEGQPPNNLKIEAEVAFEVQQGKKINLTDISASLNDRKLSSRFTNLLKAGINDRFDLDILASQGFIARILDLKMDEKQLEIATFFRLSPSAE
ncbi:MAG: DUF2993 domain-containing protein [Crocosphaera sp.]|nr:DUF2993 domain-containing protein [Crocosphaera sp.]